MTNKILMFLMLAEAMAFMVTDIIAAAREHGRKNVTASSWVRLYIRRYWWACALAALTVVWEIWHFFVQAWKPELPF